MDKHVCPWWLAYTFDNPLRRFFHKPEQIISPYLKSGMTALDLGCGLGFFSIGMARIVGKSGRVISIDVQQKMLDIMMNRAAKAHVSERITPILSANDTIDLLDCADFALAFWMIHETPDAQLFLRQVHDLIKPGGCLLITEPKMHVTVSEFNTTVSSALKTGFQTIDEPSVSFSRSVVFQKIS
jgi:ubiquinone/menaquinone biosynthesis C-methylase UbiE